ncbi:MAG TPA: hypothetical protein VNV66_10405 [Pilimelia sp.]|nr:hypothetical protein [Pilimelia sp.]
MSRGPVHRPALSADAEHNRRRLQQLLDATPGGTLHLPAGVHPLRGGLTVPGGWTLLGPPGGAGGPTAWLTVEPDRGAPDTPGGGNPADTPDDGGLAGAPGAGGGSDPVGASGPSGGEQPLLWVVGSGVCISDLGLRPAPSAPGEHSGDLGTAVTVGRYLYPAEPEWIDNVEIRRVQVRRRPGDRAANCVAVMGAVRDLTVHDVAIEGGCTGLAVHWGAVGTGVEDIRGPSYHPHRLRISQLRVRDAMEGFYLSSVHDVTVADVCLSDVDIGFRLLPGDNTDRFHRAGGAVVGRRIEVRRVCVRWRGDKYGVRIAGWGRSEIDGTVSVLEYRDVAVRDCVIRRSAPTSATPARSWGPVVVESADTVTLHNVRVESGAVPAVGCCLLGAGTRGAPEPVTA